MVAEKVGRERTKREAPWVRVASYSEEPIWACTRMRITDAIAVGFWAGFGFSLWGVVLYIIYAILSRLN